MEERISCPVCSSGKNKFFWQKNNYKLYSCENCELVFVWPIPDNLNQIYKRDYFRSRGKLGGSGYSDYDQDKKPMREVFMSFLNKFERLGSGRSIFDVGAATGYFLDLAKGRGWQTSGSEISEYARQIAKGKGHDVVGDLLEKGFYNRFDVVTMWDVLEHLRDPKEYLRTVNKILLPKRWLAINTIDKGSWWARIWGKQWHLIVPPEHLYYFSRKNLELLLNDTGFQIVEIKKIGKKFSLSYIFKILYHWQKLKIWHVLSRWFDRPFWRKLSIPINLRDNIFILAQKVRDV